VIARWIVTQKKRPLDSRRVCDDHVTGYHYKTGWHVGQIKL
jgi:hypothetical protein